MRNESKQFNYDPYLEFIEVQGIKYQTEFLLPNQQKLLTDPDKKDLIQELSLKLIELVEDRGKTDERYIKKSLKNRAIDFCKDLQIEVQRIKEQSVPREDKKSKVKELGDKERSNSFMRDRFIESTSSNDEEFVDDFSEPMGDYLREFERYPQLRRAKMSKSSSTKIKVTTLMKQYVRYNTTKPIGKNREEVPLLAPHFCREKIFTDPRHLPGGQGIRAFGYTNHTAVR